MLRRSPRALALWGFALVVAVVTATVVAGDLASLHRRAAGLGAQHAVVVATHDLSIGTTVTADTIATRSVYRSQRPPDVIESRADAIGRVVSVPVLRGAFVGQRNLAPRHRTGLDGVVPAGMRAMRVVTTDSLRPRAGASVDVLASYASSGSGGADDNTVLVADGVLVLGTDSRAASGGGRSGANGVTLLVDPEQARALADAQANGVLTLALVPPEDAR